MARNVLTDFESKFRDPNNITAFHHSLIERRFHFLYPAETEGIVRVFRQYFSDRVRVTEEYLVEHRGVVEGLDKEVLDGYERMGFITDDLDLRVLGAEEFPGSDNEDWYVRRRMKGYEERILLWEPVGWKAVR